MWRVGTKVHINVYDGDRPVCQCHNAQDAAAIVAAMNEKCSCSASTILSWLEEYCLPIGRETTGWFSRRRTPLYRQPHYKTMAEAIRDAMEGK
jgi:hypothetical protein